MVPCFPFGLLAGRVEGFKYVHCGSGMIGFAFRTSAGTIHELGARHSFLFLSIVYQYASICFL
jgi:hypothetical protein